MSAQKRQLQTPAVDGVKRKRISSDDQRDSGFHESASFDDPASLSSGRPNGVSITASNPV